MYCLLLRANTRHITPRAPRSRCLGSADKKRPLGSHPQRSGVLFPVTSSECSRRSALRSGRTVRGGSDDRSWFGRPQAIKKGGRECRQQQGDERVENAGVTSGTTLFRQSAVPWVPFTNCQKKEGSHPLSVRRIAPSPKKQPKDYAGFTYWSSPLQPNDYWGQQPKKKQRSHPLLCSTHSSLTDDALLCSLRYKPFHHR